jgi:hypothetical protein
VSTPRLSDYSRDVFSQGGEDGCIAEVLRRLGITDGFCVEFGAGDGVGCSNTKLLRDNGWAGLLIEADPDLAERCQSQTSERVIVLHQAIAAGGPDSIDAVLHDRAAITPDVMSIDVDGDDYWIALAMQTRPRLLVIEFNPTVPPHLDLIPAGPGNRFGVGPLTMRRAAEQRGYTMVGISHANMMFVQTPDAGAFADLETDLAVLLPPERYIYLATDYTGRVVPVGARPEWGLVWPPSVTRFVPNQPNLLEVGSVDTLDQLMRQVEKVDGVIAALTELRTAVQALVDKEGA